MALRIILAGLAGGALIFGMGAFNHMVLELQARTIQTLPNEPAVADQVRGVKPGLYMFPGLPEDHKQHDQKKLFAEMNERYKQGPAGMLVIAPSGEDMMSGETLFKEFVSNTICALLASWIIAQFAANVPFGRRWLAAVLIGMIGWFSYIASYGIWYRFPHDFVHDEALCGLLEWSAAGLAIAALVRPTSTKTVTRDESLAT
jgi:hypothetical protein